jgi:hypothetical protein
VWCGVAGQSAPRSTNPWGASPSDMAKRHRAGMPTRRPAPPGVGSVLFPAYPWTRLTAATSLWPGLSCRSAPRLVSADETLPASAGTRRLRPNLGVTGLGRTAPIRNARRASCSGGRRTPSTWPTTTAAGSRRTETRSEPRTAATVSASATTPTTGSEGEPATASIGRGSEPDSPTRLPRQPTAHKPGAMRTFSTSRCRRSAS